MCDYPVNLEVASIIVCNVECGKIGNHWTSKGIAISSACLRSVTSKARFELEYFCFFLEWNKTFKLQRLLLA